MGGEELSALWELAGCVSGCSCPQHSHGGDRGVCQLPGVHDHPGRVPDPRRAPENHAGPGHGQGERDGLGRLCPHHHCQPHGGNPGHLLGSLPWARGESSTSPEHSPETLPGNLEQMCQMPRVMGWDRAGVRVSWWMMGFYRPLSSTSVHHVHSALNTACFCLN